MPPITLIGTRKGATVIEHHFEQTSADRDRTQVRLAWPRYITHLADPRYRASARIVFSCPLKQNRECAVPQAGDNRCGGSVSGQVSEIGFWLKPMARSISCSPTSCYPRGSSHSGRDGRVDSILEPLSRSTGSGWSFARKSEVDAGWRSARRRRRPDRRLQPMWTDRRRQADDRERP